MNPKEKTKIKRPKKGKTISNQDFVTLQDEKRAESLEMWRKARQKRQSSTARLRQMRYLFFLIFPVFLFSQVNLSGEIKDQTGYSIMGANIIAVNNETQILDGFGCLLYTSPSPRDRG